MAQELGVVSVLKAQFGFIRPCNRGRDVFFHKGSQAAGAQLAVGDEVSFVVAEDLQTNRLAATDVVVVPQGTAKFHVVSDEQHVGVVVEGCTASSSGPAILLFLEQGRPRHLSFWPQDVDMRGAVCVPAGGAFMRFRISTDTRAAASAGGVPEGDQRRRHGVQKACQVVLMVSRAGVLTALLPRWACRCSDEPLAAQKAAPYACGCPTPRAASSC
jgi:cold shock CspA family protein